MSTSCKLPPQWDGIVRDFACSGPGRFVVAVLAARRCPKVPDEVCVIRTMSRENQLWGAPKIHGELLNWGSTLANQCQ